MSKGKENAYLVAITTILTTIIITIDQIGLINLI
jgi:hypothetical protein